MNLIKITPTKLIGSLILGSTFIVGAQGIKAENRNSETKIVRDLENRNFNLAKEKQIDPLIKKVEELKPETKERKKALNLLKEIAILQSKSENKSVVNKKLIELMNKNQTKSNWSELVPVVLDILKKQDEINNRCYRNFDNTINNYWLDEEIVKSMSGVLFSVFNDYKEESKEVQNEAKNIISVFLNSPFYRSEITVPWHKNYLKFLANLPEKRADEVKDGLIELQRLYSHVLVPGYNNADKLYNESKIYFEKMFEENLNRLLNDDLKIQKIGFNNIEALCYQFTSSSHAWLPPSSMQSLLQDKRKNIDKFFDDAQAKLKAKNYSAKSVETILKGAFLLLELGKNEPIYHAKFVDVINTGCNNSKGNKEKQNVLEQAIRDELSILHKISEKQRVPLAKAMLQSYTELTKENNNDVEFLTKAIFSIEKFKQNKDISGDSLILLDSVIDGFEKLNKKEVGELKSKILELPQSWYFRSDNQATQTLVVERLSKIYCKEQNSSGFSFLIKSFLSPPSPEFPSQYRITTKWHPYSLYKLIDNNKDYFEKNINFLIKTIKTTDNEKIRLNAKNILLETYKTFQYIPEAKQIAGAYTYLDPMLVDLNKIDELKDNVTEWYNKKLERPMFQTVLFCLEKESAKVDLKSNGIRFINNKDWQEFNKSLSEIVRVNLDLKKETLNAVIKRLESDKSSYNRQMLFKLLGDLTYSNEDWDENLKLIAQVKNEFSKESPQTAYLIGGMLPSGWQVNYYTRALKDFAVVKEINPKELSPVDVFKFDLISTLNFNSKLYKTYLPEYSFEQTKEKKIDEETFNAILKLRENAFHATSSIRYLHPFDYDLTEYLESKLETIGTSKTLPSTWGRETASLITLYLKKKNYSYYPEGESDAYLNSKLDFLKKRFFNGIEKTHTIDGQKKIYTTIPLFNRILESEFIKLNPDENRKVLDELYSRNKTPEEIRSRIFTEAPVLGGKYREMRKTFALNMLDMLCEREPEKFREYLDYLESFGFRESEMGSIVAAFVDRKE